MEKIKLNAQKRTNLRKKVKRLRKQGILPGNIYGKGIESQAVQVTKRDFEQAYKKTGGTGLIDLEVTGGKVQPVLVQSVQRDPVSDEPIHIDFYKVDLKQKITTTVPLSFVGEAQAVKEGKGVFLSLLNEVEVECLPEEIPSEIEVDVTELAELDQAITVGDLSIPEKVDLKIEKEELVCKIGELMKEEEEEVKEEEAISEVEVEREKKEEGEEETGEETKEEGKKPQDKIQEKSQEKDKK